MVSSVGLYGSQGVGLSDLYSGSKNGVTSSDLYAKKKNGVSASDLYKNTNIPDLSSVMNNITANIKPGGISEYNKTVVIDGQEYDVVQVQDNNSMLKTLAPQYKEVVIIDGEQYDVQTVPDRGCGMTKEIVVVDGKQYDVKDGHQLNLFV